MSGGVSTPYRGSEWPLTTTRVWTSTPGSDLSISSRYSTCSRERLEIRILHLGFVIGAVLVSNVIGS